MTNKCLHILLFLSLFPMNGAAIAQSDSFKIRVNVDLTTIEVFALDNKGKPVHNLKSEDFSLFEDGREQEILSFDEVNGEDSADASAMPLLAESGPHRGKTIIILFNDSSMDPKLVQESRVSAEKFVREHMRPQDLFAVVCFSGSMKILQNLTSDRQDVLAALSYVSGRTGSLSFEDMLHALENINYSLAPLKGQKSVLIYGRLNTYFGATLLDSYMKTLEAAKKSNVVYYTIFPGAATESDRGAIAGVAGFDPLAVSGTPNLRRGSPQLGHGSPVTLRSLANESGGYTIIDTNNVNAALAELDQQISNYYILGFRSNSPKRDGAFRQIKVKTKLKGVSLKHRSGYQDRRPIDSLAGSRQEQALQVALASPGDAAQLPVTFRPAYFYDSPGSARVLLAAKIGVDKLTFRKKGSQLSSELNIMGAAYSEEGSVAARFSEAPPIRIDKEKEAEFRKTGFEYQNYFLLRPGKYRLKIAAADESGSLGSAEQFLEVPPLSEKGFGVSSLILAENTSSLPDLIQNLQNQLLDQVNPLVYSGKLLQLSADNRIPVNSSVAVMFRAYNLPGAPEEWRLTATAMLSGEDGRKIALPSMDITETLSPTGPAEAAVAVSLPFQNVPPGKYRLAIQATEPRSGQSATLQTDLEFVSP